MSCYQVIVRFEFIRKRLWLVSTAIERRPCVNPQLVKARLPFGTLLRQSRFFKSVKEAAYYVLYLRAVYKNRIIPKSPLYGGQLTLF